MAHFRRELLVPVPRDALAAWHERAGAFERLGPPWQTMRSVRADPLAEGAKRIFEVKKAGVWMRWVADHRDVVPGEAFTDVQEKGPFKEWRHTHRFEQEGESKSRLVDEIEYALPMGALGRVVAGGVIERDIERMFTYRHRVTHGDLNAHAVFADRPRLRVAVTGASGLIGTQLCAYLRTGGHEVLELVRSEEAPAEHEVRWSVHGGVRDLEKLEGIDAIVHLAGANIATRWTDEAKTRIRESRVDGTAAIVDAIAALDAPPSVLVSASGVGFYGDTGTHIVTEDAPLGDGFLAEVCDAWETAARAAEAGGTRVVRARIGVVLDPRGGALSKLLPVFKAGLGGRVGGGNQLVSWVALDDVVSALHHAIYDDGLTGAMNVCSPSAVTQAELARVLGTVLRRPAIAPAPAAAIRTIFGEMGEETVLTSVGATPAALLEAGYRFRFESLEDTLRHGLGHARGGRGEALIADAT